VESKISQVGVPIFDGLEDTLQWFTRVEHFFDGQGTPEGSRVCTHPISGLWQEERYYGTSVSSMHMVHLHGGSSLCCCIAIADSKFETLSWLR
jgi:hypothetical protein